MARRWSKPLLIVGASAAVVAGLVLAGHRARDWLDRRGHFMIALADIQCSAPPGLDRPTFLSEVQYLGGLSDRFSAMDPTMALQLASAFAGHPWVERVDSVSLRAPEGPRAFLTFRTPVLAVNGRAVDSHGVLLPITAPLSDLIVFRGAVAAPKTPAGAPWGDPTVESVARIVGLLAPFQDRLRLTHADASKEGLVFTGGVTLLWGNSEDADGKIARLQAILQKSTKLASTVDVAK
jgi:hypothetical protein